MVNKENIDSLLSDIGELQKLTGSMRETEEIPIRILTQASSLALKLLENFKHLETEQIQLIGQKMAKQQEELLLLSKALESFRLSAQQQKELIEETMAAPTYMPEPPAVPLAEEVALPPPAPVMQAVIAQPVVMQPTAPEVSAAPEAPLTKTPETVELSSSEKANISLNDLLEKKILSDFRKAFSLNDRFRFRRELFGGDEVKMNLVIDDLDAIHSYKESVAYINNVLKWNPENEHAADFIKLLEKRFL